MKYVSLLFGTGRLLISSSLGGFSLFSSTLEMAIPAGTAAAVPSDAFSPVSPLSLLTFFSGFLAADFFLSSDISCEAEADAADSDFSLPLAELPGFTSGLSPFAASV